MFGLMKINEQNIQSYPMDKLCFSFLAKFLEFQYFRPHFWSQFYFFYFSHPSLFILSFSYYQLTQILYKLIKQPYAKGKKSMVRAVRSIVEEAL